MAKSATDNRTKEIYDAWTAGGSGRGDVGRQVLKAFASNPDMVNSAQALLPFILTEPQSLAGDPAAIISAVRNSSDAWVQHQRVFGANTDPTSFWQTGYFKEKGFNQTTNDTGSFANNWSTIATQAHNLKIDPASVADLLNTTTTMLSRDSVYGINASNISAEFVKRTMGFAGPNPGTSGFNKSAFTMTNLMEDLTESDAGRYLVTLENMKGGMAPGEYAKFKEEYKRNPETFATSMRSYLNRDELPKVTDTIRTLAGFSDEQLGDLAGTHQIAQSFETNRMITDSMLTSIQRDAQRLKTLGFSGGYTSNKEKQQAEVQEARKILDQQAALAMRNADLMTKQNQPGADDLRERATQLAIQSAGLAGHKGSLDQWWGGEGKGFEGAPGISQQAKLAASEAQIDRMLSTGSKRDARNQAALSSVVRTKMTAKEQREYAAAKKVLRSGGDTAGASAVLSGLADKYLSANRSKEDIAKDTAIVQAATRSGRQTSESIAAGQRLVGNSQIERNSREVLNTAERVRQSKMGREGVLSMYANGDTDPSATFGDRANALKAAAQAVSPFVEQSRVLDSIDRINASGVKEGTQGISEKTQQAYNKAFDQAKATVGASMKSAYDSGQITDKSELKFYHDLQNEGISGDNARNDTNKAFTKELFNRSESWVTQDKELTKTLGSGDFGRKVEGTATPAGALNAEQGRAEVEEAGIQRGQAPGQTPTGIPGWSAEDDGGGVGGFTGGGGGGKMQMGGEVVLRDASGMPIGSMDYSGAWIRGR